MPNGGDTEVNIILCYRVWLGVVDQSQVGGGGDNLNMFNSHQVCEMKEIIYQ